MSLNRMMLPGTIGQYGVKITWTDAGKPQTSFTLVYAELGREGISHRTFVPVLINRPQAEAMVETLEPGDVLLGRGQASVATLA